MNTTSITLAPDLTRQILLNLSVWLGAIAFNALFWQEAMGLNTLLFTLLTMTALFSLHPECRSSRSVLYLSGSLIFLSIIILLHNSLLSKIMYWLNFILLSGTVQRRELKFLFFGFLLGLANFIKTPLNIVNNLKVAGKQNLRLYTFLRFVKIAVLPLVILLVFFQIYFTANIKFAEIISTLLSKIASAFTFNLSFWQLQFFLLGLFISGMLLLKNFSSYFQNIEDKLPDTLQRHRKTDTNRSLKFLNTLGLKREYQSALILLISLNVLLFIVNLLDLRYVWIGTTFTTPQELSSYVHEGTYLLIASVLLAAGLILWHFRGNLNFYPENELLRHAAVVWVIQNGILALSVGVRNWKYVSEYGLAYKRIGVFIFLFMLLAGLFFLFHKIEKKYSPFRLACLNARAIWIVLLLSCLINWDVVITKYNLSGITATEEIDTNFLIFQVSDKNLYLLDEFFAAHTMPNINGLNYKLEGKKKRFRNRKSKHTWLSWNFADYKNEQYIE